jgi:hypothetical protein
MPTPPDDRESTAVHDRLADRLDAVERALTGSERSVESIVDEAAAADERASLAGRLSALESRVDELEAATQAVRGYVGSIHAVNRDVEQRAELALARATAAHEGYATDRDEAFLEEERSEAGGALVDRTALAAAVPATDHHAGAVASNGESGRAATTKDDRDSVTSRALDRLRERV